MKKIQSNRKFAVTGMVLLLVLINLFFSFYHFRWDLTEEKRYTLSDATRNLLRNLKQPVSVEVLLDGDMPAGFKKLSNSTKELLQDFKENASGRINFQFKKPGEGLNDSMRSMLIDSLAALGLRPTNVKAQVKEGEGSEERFLFPGAVLRYKNRTIAVDLLQGQSAMGGLNALNNAEALLEYKMVAAIRRITQDTIPLIGYLAGNGEPLTYNVYDLVERNLKKDFAFRFLPLDMIPGIPPVFSAIIIDKPTQAFSDYEKLKIDQYVMNGGKVLWMIDPLYAELDSLQRSRNDFIAFDRALNLDDLLFKYGVRINPDLVQDLNCDKLPSKVGEVGGKPQFELLPWPYFPLAGNYSNHPIAKNLDYVLLQFPSSIDTVKAPGIRKTILLASSSESRILGTPAMVSWNSIQTQDDMRRFNQQHIPFAVLLEGKFHSLYANRLTQELNDSLVKSGITYQVQSPQEGKMIVISDGDLAWNPVNSKEGPLLMGMNPYTQYQYANREFVMNCLEYLTDNTGILAARGKDFTLRLLDKKKLNDQKDTWILINIALPALLVMFLGALFNYVRKNKYARPLVKQDTA